MNHVLGRMSEKSSCGVSFRTVGINDLDFADEAVISAEINEVLAGSLDSLSEVAELLGSRVYLIKTKVRAFSDILDATVESISDAPHSRGMHRLVYGLKLVISVESFLYH